MSSSHLFLGLPIALLILYLVLSSRFQSAAFLNHLSLGEVAILSASFHFISLCVLFQNRIFALDIFSLASSMLLSLCIQSSLLLQSMWYQFLREHRLQMKLHCPRHCKSLCSVRHRFHHQCYACY